MEPQIGQVLHSLSGLLMELASAGPEIMALISSFCYLMGIAFFGLSVHYAVQTANSRARTSITSNAWWVTLLASIALMALPHTLSGFAVSVFGADESSSPFAYGAMLGGQGMRPGSCAMGWLDPLLKIYGVVAVIRGIFVIRAVGSYGRGATGDSPGKAVRLWAAGILLIRLVDLLTLIHQKFGSSMVAPLCK